MTYEEIIRELRGLKAEDFDYNPAVGINHLYKITAAIKMIPSPERLIPEMFAVIERLSESDMGAPGPLVHALEEMSGKGYEQELVRSIQRQPTSNSVGMVNSILNAGLSSESRNSYMNLLRDVVRNPDSSEDARNRAEHYIEYQNDRIP
ncbi:MAG: hypothetical protein WCP60_05390 [bacterium]